MDALCIADDVDSFAEDLLAEGSRLGIKIARCTPFTAVSLFTIRHHASGTHVEPNLPVFLRTASTQSSSQHADASFISGESSALLWAAMALTPAKVINRPSLKGFWGELQGPISLIEHQCAKGLASPEIFIDNSPTSLMDLDEWWATDGLTTALARSGQLKSGPLRLRPSISDPGYEEVFVVGQSSWSVNGALTPSIHRLSQQVAKHLRLDFVSIIWAVDKEMKPIRLVRISPTPQPERNFSHYEAIVQAVIGLVQ